MTREAQPKSRIYLDHAASAPLRPEARDAILEALSAYGNPSSVHHEGRLARRQLDDARRRIAAQLDVAPANVLFLSSATEANNLVLRQSKTPALVSAIEHPSVLASAGARTIPVNENGLVDLEQLARMLDDEQADIVSIMQANNEIGAIQPITDIADIVHAHGGRLHVDAVQALGRCPLDVSVADFLSLSAHKIGGPKGCGALVIQNDAEIAPLLRGGGQERQRRAGTENIASAVGFAAALDAISDDEGRRIESLRDRFEAELGRRLPGAQLVAKDAPRVAHISAVGLPDSRAETLVMRLDLDGVAVSAGAACSSGKVGPSHVLAAIGLPAALAASTIRVSFGWTSTADDVDGMIDALVRACPTLA